MTSKTVKTTARAIADLKKRFPSTNTKKREAAKVVVSRALCEHIAANVLKRSPASAARWLRKNILPGIPLASNWHRDLLALADALACPDDIASNLVFKLDGNSKLPFAAFSSLPGHDCPGAGACLAFCYSYRAWRYPAAFCRQVLSSMLLRHRQDIVERAFLALPDDITLRLYVDGDFASADIARFWFGLLARRPDVNCYGYSKSWQLLIDLDDDNFRFPTNYLLNLSSGGTAPQLAERVQQIRRQDGTPLVRGQFVAVGVSGDFPRGAARYDSPEYHDAVRASAAALGLGKVFSCPGKCGECGAAKHICGSDKAHGVIIAIGIH